MSFSEMELCGSLAKAVAELGYENPTEIQEKAIPLLSNHEFDFVGQAQTGTGKTAAFLLPLLERLDFRKPGVQALILAPTRELASQVEGEVRKLGSYLNVKTALVYGGTSYDRQIRDIRNGRAQIVVGTPGRVIDLMDRRILDFSSSDFLILDEADEMLNMGFLEDVKKVLQSFSEERKLWMFSATMPSAIKRLIESEFRNPEFISIKKKTLSNENIEQKYFVVDRRHRSEALHQLLQVEEDVYGIVFCKTRAETKELTTLLLERGLRVDCLHGDMGQNERDYAMERFKSGRVKMLICTDVAARGIDINNLTHVFNFGLPQDLESYVHRIGRTGRAGNKGKAYLILDPRDRSRIRHVENLTRSKMEQGSLPKPKDLKKKVVEHNLANVQPIIDAVLAKGEDFKVDSSYEIFEKLFEGVEKEELQKIIFTYLFNKEIRRLDEKGDLNSRARAPRAGSVDRGGRGRRGGRSQGGQRSERRDSRSGGGHRGRRSERSARSEGGAPQRERRDRSGRSERPSFR